MHISRIHPEKMVMRCTCPRNGFVLIAVLVVVTAALLIATSLLFIAQGRVTDSASAATAAQLRCLATSGMQAIMSQLQDQRERILQGELPQLDRQYIIYESAGRAGVVRVLPMSRGSDRLLAPEAGKIDVNAVDAAALVRTGLFEQVAADAIIAHREQTLQRPYQSINELLNVPGAEITPEELLGPLEEIRPRDQSQLVQESLADRISARLLPAQAAGLADVLTVFSIEPELQMDGSRRFSINGQWSAAMEQDIRKRFGDEAFAKLKTLQERGQKLASKAEIIRWLSEQAIPQETWTAILDAFAADDAAHALGRLDLNTASVESLLSLETMTLESATRLVSERERLSASDRATILWPLTSQIMSLEEFTKIADRVTCRCWTYRVRIAVGEVELEQPDGRIPNPMIFELVLDLSMPKPRISYLRDISVLQAAVQIALESQLLQDRQPQDASNHAVEPSAGNVAGSASNSSPATLPRDESEEPPAPTAAPKRVARWRSG